MEGGEERRRSTHGDGKCTMMQKRKGSAESQTDTLLQKLWHKQAFQGGEHKDEILLIFRADADISFVIYDDIGRLKHIKTMQPE